MIISVITINLNNKSGLQKTIESVVGQYDNNLEYIVIDGASTDGSVEVITQYEDKISYWISESDKGIYNAMNKGIAKATGDYLLFLNSGDVFYNSSVVVDFNKVIENQKQFFDLYSGTIAFDKHGRRNYEEAPNQLTFGFFFLNTLRHPCTFIAKRLFDVFGNYNEANKIVSDWEFFLTAASHTDTTYHKLNFAVALFDVNGIGNNPSSKVLIENEQRKFLEYKFSFFYSDYLRSKMIENELGVYKNSRAHKVLGKLLNIIRR